MSRSARAPRGSTGTPRPVRASSPRSGDPYGLLPAGTPIAAIVAAVGLLLVGAFTLNLLNGQLPIGGGGGDGNGSGNGGAGRTAAPSNVIEVPTSEPVKQTPGIFVYAKAGNIWLQQAGEARQLTDGGRDAMPSFSPDGASVYFVRTRRERGRWVAQGRERTYELDIPSLMRVPVAGGEPELVLDGIVRDGRLKWHAWIRQPVLSPNGRTLALVSDLADPRRSNVVLQFLDLQTRKRTKPDVAEVPPLGHQDPEWRHDGRFLLYVKNDREGAKGEPEIWRYNVERGTASAVTGPGYLSPSWSRDGRWVAVTKTSSFGTDIVILEARRFTEVLRVTSDGRSWSPVFSPFGDGIAFLHAEGQIVDLRLVPLEGTAGSWTLGEPIELTSASGLDSGSRPDWFVPESELPPLPTPAPTAVPSAVATPSP